MQRLGELVAERSGVLNLGVEGMMLMGAVSAFAATSIFGSPYVGVFAGAIAGTLTAAVFSLFALGLATNQVATGLALTIFGTGLSGLVGAPFVGGTVDGLPNLAIPLLIDIPVIGNLLFNHDIMAYLSIGVLVLVAWFLNRTRAGLVLRAVGNSHDQHTRWVIPCFCAVLCCLFWRHDGRTWWRVLAPSFNATLV